jgi:hypothetical protein
MVCSAVFIMDLKGKILISRNYRGDIPMSVSEKFTKHLSVDTHTTHIAANGAAARYCCLLWLLYCALGVRPSALL